MTVPPSAFSSISSFFQKYNIVVENLLSIFRIFCVNREPGFQPPDTRIPLSEAEVISRIILAEVV